MSARGLAAALLGMRRRRLARPHMVDEWAEERSRALLKNLHGFDEHLLRDIGFRDEVSRFHRRRFQGF